MAGAKETPRQKMVSLMYLVFISMLALNMGKEVLSAFGLMNEKLEKSNVKYAGDNAQIMEQLSVKAQERPDFKENYDKAKKVSELSNSYVEYLEVLKKDILVGNLGDVDNDPDAKANLKNYQVMDKSDYLDGKFFSPDGYKPAGKEFLDRLIGYRTEITNLLGKGHDDIKEAVADRFQNGDENGKVTNVEGNKVDWLNYCFEGYPYIAALTRISQLQADVRQTEQDFYKEMLAGQMAGEVSMSNYTTLLEQPKGAYYQNQTFDGALVLGRKDNSTKPSRVELAIDGRKLSPSEYEVTEGKVRLKVNSGNVGEHKITGKLFYAQGGQEIAVDVEDKTFTTIPRPNEAVISADKMNVVYRGVNNPMTISMPGVSDNNISVSAPGLSRKSGSSYNIKPGATKEVTISVTGTIEGEKFSSSKKFRVKDIPRPQGAILKTTGTVKLGKDNVARGPVSVVFEDFDFDLTANVTEFRISVPGNPSVVVRGSSVGANPTAVAAVNRAKKGDIIQIMDIKYNIPGYEGTPKPASAVSIEIL